MWSRLWIVSVVAVLSAQSTSAQQKAFELDEVVTGALSARGFGGTWVSDTEFIFTNATTGQVQIHNVATNVNTTLVEKAFMDSLNVASYTRSPDGQYLLLAYDTQSIYRHSTRSKFAVYNTTSRAIQWILQQGELLQLAAWAPQGNAIAYVYGNNIYYISALNDAAVLNPIALTTQGVEGVIYCGVPDWVYEEEVLGSGSAMWFSPNGAALAYAVFNDYEVPEASYVIYGDPGELTSQYTEIVKLRYPKAGRTNPTVTMNVVPNLNAVTLVHQTLSVPVNIVSNDHILWDVSWPNSEEVIVTWKNRVQNVAQITSYNITTSAVNPAAVPELLLNETKGWLILPKPVYDQTGANYLNILSSPQSNLQDSFSHLTRVTRSTGITVALTSGNRVVTNIYGWDTSTGRIYYQGTEEDEPSRRQVYSVASTGGTPQCLSCNVNTTKGNPCQFAAASFSTNFRYYALTCSGPDPAIVNIYDATNTLVRTWQNNSELRAIVDQRLLPTYLDDRINVTGGYQAHVRLWLPPNMDRSGATKYPMVVYVYGGPGSQQITDTFTLGFGAYLATNRSYIYALIDGRGSSYKGDNMLFELYLKLGQAEVEDQINVTRALQQKYAFIDATRTGIWGWSYGGYATAMALAKDSQGVFKCGIAVAPVSSWIYYDTIYTERYMGLPTNVSNLEGYDNGDVTRLAENFEGKDFYLMHGNADDNVHYQQAMVLAKALEEKGVLFSQQSYPDENHSIRSVITHVYHSQDKFWSRCFEQPAQQESAAFGLRTPELGLLLLIFIIQQAFL